MGVDTNDMTEIVDIKSSQAHSESDTHQHLSKNSNIRGISQGKNILNLIASDEASSPIHV